MLRHLSWLAEPPNQPVQRNRSLLLPASVLALTRNVSDKTFYPLQPSPGSDSQDLANPVSTSVLQGIGSFGVARLSVDPSHLAGYMVLKLQRSRRPSNCIARQEELLVPYPHRFYLRTIALALINIDDVANVGHQ